MATPNGPSDPLRAAALEQLERMRPACEGAPDGVSVFEAVAHCMRHRLMPPQWLNAVFLTRHALVRDAHVGSLDEAFGRPWPPRTRLAQVRLDRKRRAAVHAALWDAVKRGESLNDDLCDRVGELPGIDASGATVWRRYSEALKAGAMDLALWRSSQDCQLSPES